VCGHRLAVGSTALWPRVDEMAAVDRAVPRRF
jgi:hypothetical protein